MNNIGFVYYNKGEYEKALANYSKSLKTRIKILGPDSIDVARSLNNIGLVYYTKGEYTKALEHYNKCLEIQTKILG
jgi:tetratricopeptide (TPR) repeat protein